MRKIASRLLIVLVLISLPRMGFGARLVISPYIQNVTPTSAVIRWQAGSAAPGRLVLSSKDGDVRLSTDRAAAFGEIKATGLAPGTEYHYALTLGSSSSPIASGTFRTFPQSAQSVRFVVYGDTRSNPDRHARVTQSMAAEPDVLFALHTGDLVADGRKPDLWKREFFGPAAALMARVPLYAVLGNHERNSSNYFHYLSLPGNGRWYSFDAGDVHVVALDSNTSFDQGSQQYKWLVSDLAGHKPAKWKFVFLHHPVYGSGSHCGVNAAGVPREKPIAAARRLFPGLAAKFGITAFFSGHDHIYERSTREGVVYIVTGGGGAPLYSDSNRRSNPYRQVYTSANHYCVVSVDGDNGWIVAKTPDGKVIDKVEIRAR